METQEKSLLLKWFDILWTLGIASLLIDFLVHFVSLIYTISIPAELFKDYFNTYIKIRTVYTNIGVSCCFTFVIVCFFLLLIFMNRVFKVYRGKDSKEIKRRTTICGTIIIACVILRMAISLYHIGTFVIKFTSEEEDRITNEQAAGIVQYTDIPLIIFLKFLPSLAIIIMMNKPQLC